VPSKNENPLNLEKKDPILSPILNSPPAMEKNRGVFLSSGIFFLEIYILNNKKFKWRYYQYGQENRVDLPKYTISFHLFSGKVDI
jgi:hypothetical protein